VSSALSVDEIGGPRPKTWPFKRWAEQLAEGTVSSSGDVASREDSGKTAAAGSVHEFTASLSADETHTLQEKLASVWRADLGEALLTGFARALAAWTEGRVLHVDFIQDGRGVFEGFDCSRTVGCFDVSRPLRIELPEGADEALLLKGVKEEVRRLPLQASGDDPAPLSSSRRNEVGLRLLGGSAPIPEGLSGRGLPGGRFLELEGFLSTDRLHVRCTHDGDTVPAPERLVADVLGALRALCAGDREARSAISPTDFPLAGLDASQMDALALLIDQTDQANDP
jgi:hypothetical protein